MVLEVCCFRELLLLRAFVYWGRKENLLLRAVVLGGRWQVVRSPGSSSVTDLEQEAGEYQLELYPRFGAVG